MSSTDADAKTGNKTATSPRSGAVIPTGAHPGNTGGKKGRSGRPPAAFKGFLATLRQNPASAIGRRGRRVSSIERDWLAAEQSLTESEWEVIEGIAQGWTHARISDWLGISTKTVRVHICHISAKLPPHGGLKGYARVLYWIARQPHVKQLAA